MSNRTSRPKFDIGQTAPECDGETSGCDRAHNLLTRDDSPSRDIRATFPLINPSETLKSRASLPCLPQPSKMSRDGFLGQDLKEPLPAQPSRPSRKKNLAQGTPTWAITTTERLAGSSGLRDLDGHYSVHSPTFSPDHSLATPPLILSPKKSRKLTRGHSRNPSLDKRCDRALSPVVKMQMPQGASIQKEQTEGGEGHPYPRPSLSSPKSVGPFTKPGMEPSTGSPRRKSTPSETERMSPN